MQYDRKPERLPHEDPRDYLARLLAWDNSNERILVRAAAFTAAVLIALLAIVALGS